MAEPLLAFVVIPALTYVAVILALIWGRPASGRR